MIRSLPCLFGCRRIDGGSNLGDIVRGEAPLACMFANSVLVRSDVNAVDFVLGHVAMQPLHLGAQVPENAARLLRNGLQLLGFEVPGAGNLALNYILGHSSSNNSSIFPARRIYHGPKDCRPVFRLAAILPWLPESFPSRSPKDRRYGSH